MTEAQWLRKNKICVDCKYFSPFMASAGFCGKEKICAEKMIDCMDFCKNGEYRHKIRFNFFTRLKSYIWSIKYKLESRNCESVDFYF